MYKDLGLFTASNLSWNQHVDKITAKASRVSGLVKRACSDLNDIGNFKNQNATQPETSPEVICTQSASLRMLGAKLQRVFFTFRTRGWHLQRFQKT